jgi:hypothetical protein
MSTTYLRRYTDLPALTYLLSSRKITLLDPASWDDTNDSHYLSVYKEKKNLQSVLALCFTQKTETYHHWRVFAGNSSGVCIRFRRFQLLNILESHKHHKQIRAEAVEYRTLEDMLKKKPAINRLPFIKRYAFKDDEEFRVIYESPDNKLRTLDIPIPLSCIARITLSPWSDKSFATPVKQMIKSIDGCSELEICRSIMISSREWKTIGDFAT